MKKEELRIVYMGTPDFAVESLRRLVENGYNVVGVITMPDKPAGRGHKIQFSPVKQYALSRNLPLLQPEKLKDENFLSALRAWRADLQIVVAFRMLPEVVWNMPPLGTFNLHASLLPQYRGAAPINRAIMNGDTVTGATTFFLSHEIDTGAIAQQRSVPILPDDNAGTLHDKLMMLGAEMVTDTVDALLENRLVRIEQQELIAFSQPARKIHDFVRGLSPYPAAWCSWSNGRETFAPVKIFETEVVENGNGKAVGSLCTDGKTFIEIACGSGAIRLKSLQLPAKKRLSVEELLRGFPLDETWRCD